jgi:hypothetical protein
MFLNIVQHSVFIQKHHLVYFSKHNVSETRFCLRLQAKPTQFGQIDGASPYVRTNYLIRKLKLYGVILNYCRVFLL